MGNLDMKKDFPVYPTSAIKKIIHGERCVDIEQHGVISANHCLKEVFQAHILSYSTKKTRKSFPFAKHYLHKDHSNKKMFLDIYKIL